MKLRESISFKIAAIIFSYVMAVILVISTILIGVMGYYKFYFSNTDVLKEEILTDMAQNEAYHISSLLDKGTNLEKYYKDKNVYYRVSFNNDNKVETNYGGQSYIASANADYYNYEEYLISDKYGEEIYGTLETKAADIEVFIAEDMHKNDLFSVAASVIDLGYKLRFVMVFIDLGAIAIFIFLLCYLCCAAGHTSGGEIKCNYLDKLPFDILTAIVVFLAILSIVLVDNLAYDMTSAILLVAFIGSIDYFIALGYLLTIATRIKTGTLIKNCVIYYILRFIGRYIKRFFSWVKFVFSNASLLQKAWIIVLAVILGGLVFTVAMVNMLYPYTPDFFVAIMFIVMAVIILAILYFAVIMQKIKLGGERIAKGDLQHKIDTKYMFGDFKFFAESLNNINDGLQNAVNEKMKSERFKTELITNVSHDIKTPLTSIINYVDLIKKEHFENETVNQYIDVLDRQSGRLKKLVEDLVEASKASTGNLSVNLEKCDIGVLLSQTLGEFEERLMKAKVQPVLNMQDSKIQIMADGRHLWRIFENLMSNICKYSLEGTRAYIDIKAQNKKAIITFRNISKYQLNISSDELMERFVRGDSSRNTEGSGLGLSITKSLAELQKGEMALSVDGDLFKVELRFDLI